MTDIPIGERCYRGCRRRADVIGENDQRYCAWCYLMLIDQSYARAILELERDRG